MKFLRVLLYFFAIFLSDGHSRTVILAKLSFSLIKFRVREELEFSIHINPFQPSVVFHIETSHLPCCAKHLAL